MAKRIRRKLYTTKDVGFSLVGDTNKARPYEDKFDDFIVYLWRCMPSGILSQFQEWLSTALQEIGHDVSAKDIDLALSSIFLRMERRTNDARRNKNVQ